jgi:hypothetical protein
MVLLVVAAPALPAQQGGERLRKTDLVRLLSSVTLAPDELASLIHRNCLSFTPSGRDRADFVALGADSAVLREIDECARHGTAPPAKPNKARVTPVVPPTSPPSPPSPTSRTSATSRTSPVLSPVRTGFVLGVGQHGAVGQHAAQPLLFEVRDTGGVAVAGVEVSLGVTNGRLTTSRAVTDSSGHARVDLMLGPKVGPVQVRATAGVIERQATLYADPGPAMKLAVRCGANGVEGRVSFTPGVASVLRVTAQDAFGNVAPITGLQAAAGDRGVIRVAFVGTDSAGGLVRVEPGDEGSTSLVLVASGQREDVSVTVAKPARAGVAHCP